MGGHKDTTLIYIAEETYYWMNLFRSWKKKHRVNCGFSRHNIVFLSKKQHAPD